MTDRPSTRPGMQRWITILDGGQLRHLRRQYGLSQEQRAGRSGISLTTIGRLARALDEDPAHLAPATQP